MDCIKQKILTSCICDINTNIEYEKYETIIITFRIKFDYGNINFYCDKPNIVDLKDWQDLYNGKKCKLIFCDDDGGISISSDGINVTFSILNWNPTIHGELDVTIDLELCKDAFKKYIDFANNYYK